VLGVANIAGPLYNGVYSVVGCVSLTGLMYILSLDLKLSLCILSIAG
jgi:hypothetical protein